MLIAPDDSGGVFTKHHRPRRELSLRLSATKSDQPDRRSSKSLESSGPIMDFVAE
jgi:hypothetical protein